MIEGCDRDENIHYSTAILDEFNVKFKYSSSQEHSPLCERGDTKRFCTFSECCEDGNSPSIFVSIGKPFVLLVKRAYCA